MKKAVFLLLLFILALALAACGQPVSTNEKEPSAFLLEGYPGDVLPLYQPDTLLSCGFSLRENDSYDIGKDIYTVTYESTADQQSLAEYYGSLLTEQNAAPADEEDVITDRLSGKIDDYKVDLMFLDNAGSTITVYITLGLPEDMYTEENPYFADYPDDDVEMYGLLAVREYTFQRQFYAEDELHYIIVYSTDITARDFSKYYEDAYSSKKDFTKSDPGTAFSWQDGAASIGIRYSGGDSPYITIDVSKAGG
jgi:hypothetical protein